MPIHRPSRLAALAIFLSFTLAIPTEAQVSLLFTPLPLRASRTVGIRNVGLWTVLVCNDGPAFVNLPEERILMAAPTLLALDHATALATLTQSHVRDRSVVIANLLQNAVLLSSIFTAGGLIAASPRIIVSLTLGASGAMQLANAIKGQAPDLSGIQANLLETILPLAPSSCATRTVLAGIHPGVQPVAATLP